MCTFEAKVCPDDSSVGCIPPSCESAPCPSDPGDPIDPIQPTKPTEPGVLTDDPKIVDIAIDGMKVTLTFEASRTEVVSACGPIFYAQVHWSDEGLKDVFGLGCSAQRQTLTTEHIFSTAGEHIIHVSDQ